MNTWARANCAPRPRSGRGAQSAGEGVYLAWTRDRSRLLTYTLVILFIKSIILFYLLGESGQSRKYMYIYIVVFENKNHTFY